MLRSHPQGPEIQDAVAAFDELPTSGFMIRPFVHADILRLGLVQGGFVHEHGGKGRPVASTSARA